MKKQERSKSYYSGDLLIEGAILRTFARDTYNTAANFFGLAKPIPGRSSVSGATRAMRNAIRKCRAMGLTEQEIVDSAWLNLRTYGFDAGTFPIDLWMAT